MSNTCRGLRSSNERRREHSAAGRAWRRNNLSAVRVDCLSGLSSNPAAYGFVVSRCLLPTTKSNIFCALVSLPLSWRSQAKQELRRSILNSHLGLCLSNSSPGIKRVPPRFVRDQTLILRTTLIRHSRRAFEFPSRHLPLIKLIKFPVRPAISLRVEEPQKDCGGDQ
jgi:hypothetical protein